VLQEPAIVGVLEGRWPVAGLQIDERAVQSAFRPSDQVGAGRMFPAVPGIHATANRSLGGPEVLAGERGRACEQRSYAVAEDLSQVRLIRQSEFGRQTASNRVFRQYLRLVRYLVRVTGVGPGLVADPTGMIKKPSSEPFTVFRPDRPTR